MARRLLLVEDSSIMRRMIAAMLQEEGYEVALAVDGREGLDRARAAGPELILTDYAPTLLDIHAVYPSGRHLSAKTRAYVDFLQAEFNKIPALRAS